MVIKWTKLARQDLLDFQQNTMKNKQNVNKYISKLVNYIDILMIFPFLGKTFFTIGELEVRQLIFMQHRILYKVESNKIFIIFVIHMARDIEKYIQYLKDNI